MMAAINAPGSVQHPIQLGGQWIAAAEQSAGPQEQDDEDRLGTANTPFPRFFSDP
jgi:hypothetical protein